MVYHEATIARLTAELERSARDYDVAKAFHDLAVGERNRAWNTIQVLRSEHDQAIARAEAAEARIDELEAALTRREAMHECAMAELEAVRAEITRLCDRVVEVASERAAAEALLPSAYELALADAVEAAKHAGLSFGYERAVQAIRALPIPSPADLAARLGGAE